ncbi:MAG: hypothetical protein RRB13_10740 [bacterium]|nr:hypothetical protein [bacterium]
MAGATAYDAYDLRVISPDGELVTLSAIKLDIPEYLKMEKGVLSKQWVDVKGSIRIKAETLKHFSNLAKQAGSWQDMAPIEFINLDISPVGEEPFRVVLKQVRLMVSLPEMKKLEGGALEIDLPILPGDVEINGVSVVRAPARGGI